MGTDKRKNKRKNFLTKKKKKKIIEKQQEYIFFFVVPQRKLTELLTFGRKDQGVSLQITPSLYDVFKNFGQRGQNFHIEIFDFSRNKIIKNSYFRVYFELLIFFKIAFLKKSLQN